MERDNQRSDDGNKHYYRNFVSGVVHLMKKAADGGPRHFSLNVERVAFCVRRGGIKNRESGELSECRDGQERTTNN